MRKFLSTFSGILFGVAWFLWIDGHVYENTRNAATPGFGPSIQWVYYLPGIFSTVGLVMANIIKLDGLNSSSFLGDDSYVTKIRIWLFVSFAINFGCIAGSVWIMAATFMPPHVNSNAEWPGIALTLQNVLIFLSSLTLMYSKSRNEDENPF
ncbi:transmembrane protein [Cavenderia fasciculata]|uniref:Transmembrane protein n=1 Tax=Cavenderia fasciculata TaxID=261658 RepID=F4QCT5_CACFS|nr:uncharacterized protein DFA_12231 [Cavenderia fasciculata]EGG14459.1 transmembrane protein [Cavenderia fasciculata]|eukprot:XP_004353868.1 transmembrane protein [Cavenderia fasciculata]